MSGLSWLRIGAVLGFLAVAIGAFGAHSLKDRLEKLGRVATFETGVQYHMSHALALVALGIMIGPRPGGTAGQIAGWSFLLGILLFSGSLYVLSGTGITKLGMITPFGGLAFLIGWAALAVAASGMPASPMGWERKSVSSTTVAGNADPNPTRPFAEGPSRP